MSAASSPMTPNSLVGPLAQAPVALCLRGARARGHPSVPAANHPVALPPGRFDEVLIRHQVKYLGLMENLRVRRAGFAYRRKYEAFLQRWGWGLAQCQGKGAGR